MFTGMQHVNGACIEGILYTAMTDQLLQILLYTV